MMIQEKNLPCNNLQNHDLEGLNLQHSLKEITASVQLQNKEYYLHQI